jgi:8-oxo-dGTP diphosphatase
MSSNDNEQISQYSLRVYGILLDSKKRVLLSKEWHMGRFFFKFPGGGLEPGESTLDCLKREFREELSIDIHVHQLLHISDRLFPSWFHPNTQVIAIYYSVSPVSDKDFSFPLPEMETPGQDGPFSFFWKEANSLTEEDLSLPTDQQLPPIIRALARP